MSTIQIKLNMEIALYSNVLNIINNEKKNGKMNGIVSKHYTCLSICEWKEVKCADEIKRGDHIVQQSPSIHHGIVVEILTSETSEAKQFTVIGWGIDTSNAKPSIQEYTVKFNGNNLSVIVYCAKDCHSVKKTVERARERIGEDDYGLITNHAHGFPRWCKTGYGGAMYVEPKQRAPRWTRVKVTDVKEGDHVSWWSVTEGYYWRHAIVTSPYREGLLSVVGHKQAHLEHYETSFHTTAYVYVACYPKSVALSVENVLSNAYTQGEPEDTSMDGKQFATWCATHRNDKQKKRKKRTTKGRKSQQKIKAEIPTVSSMDRSIYVNGEHSVHISNGLHVDSNIEDCMDVVKTYQYEMDFLQSMAENTYLDNMYIKFCSEKLQPLLSHLFLKNENGSVTEDCLAFDSRISLVHEKNPKLNGAHSSGISHNKSTEEQDRLLAKHYKELKQSFSRDREIHDWIQHLEPDYKEEKIYVSVCKSKLSHVQKHMEIEKTYSGVYNQLEFLAQDEDNIDLLMNNSSDTIRFVKCIGPGSAIIKHESLSAMENHVSGDLYPTIDATGSTEELQWGTLGCFVRYNTDVYILSAMHVIHKENTDIVQKEKRYLITAFNHWYDLSNITNNPDDDLSSSESDESNDDQQNIIAQFQSIKIQAKDSAYMCHEIKGIYNTFPINGAAKLVDVVLAGPLDRSFLHSHEHFGPHDSDKITIVSDELDKINETRGMELYVWKVGAKTGLTRGKVIVSDHLANINDIHGRGTFLVTTYNAITKVPEVDGKFGQEGDSGSLIFLDDDRSNKAIGILHGIYHNRTIQTPKWGVSCKQVTVCVRLDYCLEALNNKYKEDYCLYNYYLKPELCLAKQVLPNHNEGACYSYIT